MGIGTLFRHLVGERKAILEVAGSPHALWVGLLFVLSAGLAREYDGEDLLHEPWHLALPLIASLASSFALFALATRPRFWRENFAAARYFRAYRAFLGLFWMTGPLAWLYAIPYERFLSPAGAMWANLLTLAVVAAWRVALMVRILTVITNYHLAGALAVVVCFSGALLVLGLAGNVLPLIGTMGGVRPPHGKETVATIQEMFFCVALFPCSGLVVLLGDWLWGKKRPTWRVSPEEHPTLPWGLGLFALASVAVWAAVLPYTQPEQQRYRVERALARGHYPEALAEFSAHPRSDFPPHWEPPPYRFSSPDQVNRLLNMLELIESEGAPPWVREMYLNKFRTILRSTFWTRPHTETGERVARMLRRLPERPVLEAELKSERLDYVVERLSAYISELDRGAQHQPSNAKGKP
jgi:hypothetical protein